MFVCLAAVTVAYDNRVAVVVVDAIVIIKSLTPFGSAAHQCPENNP